MMLNNVAVLRASLNKVKNSLEYEFGNSPWSTFFGFETRTPCNNTVRVGKLVVRFQGLTAVSMKFRVLWDVLPCSHHVVVYIDLRTRQYIHRRL
jgi:hypothetical protein